MSRAIWIWRGLASICWRDDGGKEERRSFLKKRTKKLLNLGCFAAIFPAHAQVVSVQFLTPTRDFGYFVGDVLSTDAIITVAPGTVLDMRSLPVPGPLKGGIELRRIDAQQAAEGEPPRIRIHAEYQNFVAPEQVTAAELPGFAVQFTAGPAHATARIPAFAFHVSPLRVAQRSVADAGDLRPNRAIPPLPEAGLAARFTASLILALAFFLSLASGRGWLPGPRGAKRPFALAASRIARLSADAHSAARYLEMHRAFDATAGRRVLPRDLDDFLSNHPHFADLRQDIAAFFRASESRFFARETAPEPAGADIAKLAKSLRRRERRR
jgi:mxaA protein